MKYVGQKSISITFESDVLETFYQYRQTKNNSLEAGGQLFAKFNNQELIISQATGLRQGDKRGRFLFWPNRLKEQKEIISMHQHGLHYVGDWHTHPEAKPFPSKTDIDNIKECYLRSKHNLKYFVMVVIGTRDFPEGMHVSAHSFAETHNLECLTE